MATAVGTDGSDNVYITGYSDHNGGYDIVTLKYSAGGFMAQGFPVRFADVNDFNDVPNDIAVDSGGTFAFTGYIWVGEGTLMPQQ